jgi:hypothetical protein
MDCPRIVYFFNLSSKVAFVFPFSVQEYKDQKTEFCLFLMLVWHFISYMKGVICLFDNRVLRKIDRPNTG